MGTRARVKFLLDGDVMGGVFYSMDGHVENIAPRLIKVLKGIEGVQPSKLKRLIRFMGEDALYGERDEFLNCLCEVELSAEPFNVKVIGYENKAVFEGTWVEFSERYIRDDD